MLTASSCWVAVIVYGTALPALSFCAATAGNVAPQMYAVELMARGVLVTCLTTPLGLRSSTATSCVVYVQPHTKACLGACCSTWNQVYEIYCAYFDGVGIEKGFQPYLSQMLMRNEVC